ncbi:hypothetical protein BU17DRAFT_37174 [Hysterangium stoloniferum]|nr:hypothetical protein BU17DRAFT_37174 [Hysterangium stoloniferum]
MRTMFASLRLYAFMIVIITSIPVLGLTASLGSRFLPNILADFTIFSILVPSATILLIIFLLLRSQPRIDAVATFVLGVLWLTLAAWTVDIIGPVQCFQLGSQRMRTESGTMSAMIYCRQMKAIEALSWAVFVIFAISFVLLISLVTRAQSIGRHNVWAQSISDLPWWGEMGGLHGENDVYGAHSQYPRIQQLQSGVGGQPYIIQQQPGHNVHIRTGEPGEPPEIRQVPINATTIYGA